MPESVLILGGPEVSYAVEEVFKELPAIDFIVQGEGEEVLYNLLKKIEDDNSGRGVKGAAWLSSNENVQLEEGPQIVKDLSELEFPYDFSGTIWENKIVYYESTRGCPFTCAYCLSGISRNVRSKPLDKVYGDLQRFIQAGVRQVKFVDRTYNLDKKHYLAIMKWLCKQETKTNFHFEIKADNLDEEVLAFLATVPKGRFQFEIGIQSVHEKTLAASGRSQDWHELKNAVKKIKSFGNIHLHLDLIAGLPYESAKDFAISFNKVYTLQPDMLQLGFLKLLKGSLLEKNAEEYGYNFMPEPQYEVLSNNFISYAELRELKLLEEVFDQTYNSGRFINSLQYINEELYEKDAYLFYSQLAQWWEQKGLFLLGHSYKTVTEHLATFCQERRSNSECRRLLDCLRFDIILFHDKTYRPAWLCWQTTGTGTPSEIFWRNNELVRRYLPGYKFTSWREINNNYHIEVFEHYFNKQELKEKQAVLFIKDEGIYELLAKEDFFQ